jgi:hypothetical protein
MPVHVTERVCPFCAKDQFGHRVGSPIKWARIVSGTLPVFVGVPGALTAVFAVIAIVYNLAVPPQAVPLGDLFKRLIASGTAFLACRWMVAAAWRDFS